MPVKNGEKYIAESIESTLNQSFDDFELLIFDDNSSDHTMDIINSYKDPRISVYRSKAGYVANLNKGIAISKSNYIARMDADDIMHPQRLEIQFEIMTTYNVDVCFSWVYSFDENYKLRSLKRASGLINNPLDFLAIGNYFAHPTAILKKEFLIKNNLKYENCFLIEDYKLWFEMAKKNGLFYIAPYHLVNYRQSSDQITKIHENELFEQGSKLQNEIKDYRKKIQKS